MLNNNNYSKDNKDDRNNFFIIVRVILLSMVNSFATKIMKYHSDNQAKHYNSNLLHLKSFCIRCRVNTSIREYIIRARNNSDSRQLHSADWGGWSNAGIKKSVLSCGIDRPERMAWHNRRRPDANEPKYGKGLKLRLHAGWRARGREFRDADNRARAF